MVAIYNASYQYDSQTTYYGTTADDRPSIIVEIDTTSSEFRLSEATEFSILTYDSSEAYNSGFSYEGNSPFVDITSSVRSVEIQRGRSAQTYDHYDAGTARIVLADFDSSFMPGNPNSPHYPRLTTMRPIRVRIGWSGASISLFRGYVDRWEVDWSPTDSYSTVTVTATDLTKILNKFDTVIAGLDGDTPKERLDLMLDEHSIPAGFRVIDTGITTLISDVVDRRPMWPVCQEIETAEAGALFIDGYGRVVFKDRNNANPSGVGTLISDTATNSVSYSAIQVSTDDELLYNFVSVTASGGIEQTAGDATSEDEYQRRSLILDNILLETDALALGLANHLLAVRKDPGVRIEGVTIPTYLSTHNMRAAALLDILSPVTVERAAPGGYDYSQALYVSGIKHEITPDDWTLELSTQPQTA